MKIHDSPVFPCSSSTSSSSSIHSTISSVSSYYPSHRCHGLDLLVKAIYQVAHGSIIGVPYIQRRVIRRRKPALRFVTFSQADHPQFQEHDPLSNCDGDGNGELVVVSEPKNQKRKSKGATTKFQDSVLCSLKPKDRSRRRVRRTSKN